MYKQIQFTLTVNAGKWLIARALSELKCIKDAISHGSIIMFGGTTVSALVEILTGTPLRLSGRIIPRGTVIPYQKEESTPHTILISQGKIFDLEKIPESQDLKIKWENMM